MTKSKKLPASCVLRLLFFFQAEDGIRDSSVTGVQTCALPILAFDPQVGHVVIFGGDHIEPFGLGPINDTWEWDGSQWTQDWTSATPSARAGHTMALDANGRVVMFGGSDEGNPGRFPTNPAELGTGILTAAGSPSVPLPATPHVGNSV